MHASALRGPALRKRSMGDAKGSRPRYPLASFMPPHAPSPLLLVSLLQTTVDARGFATLAMAPLLPPNASYADSVSSVGYCLHRLPVPPAGGTGNAAQRYRQWSVVQIRIRKAGEIGSRGGSDKEGRSAGVRSPLGRVTEVWLECLTLPCPPCSRSRSQGALCSDSTVYNSQALNWQCMRPWQSGTLGGPGLCTCPQ